MINQSTIDRVIEVVTEKYHYKVSCNQVGNRLLVLTIMDTDHEPIAIIELLLPIETYNVSLRSGYHQLNSRDKRKLDELILDFSNNPVLPHLDNCVKVPRPTVFKSWEHYLDSCYLVDKQKEIYLGNSGFYQVDKYGYVTLLKKPVSLKHLNTESV